MEDIVYLLVMFALLMVPCLYVVLLSRTKLSFLVLAVYCWLFLEFIFPFAERVRFAFLTVDLVFR